MRMRVYRKAGRLLYHLHGFIDTLIDFEWRLPRQLHRGRISIFTALHHSWMMWLHTVWTRGIRGAW